MDWNRGKPNKERFVNLKVSPKEIDLRIGKLGLEIKNYDDVVRMLKWFIIFIDL